MYIKLLMDVMICRKKTIFYRLGMFHGMPGTVLNHETLNYTDTLLFVKELKREGNYCRSNKMSLKTIILNLFDD